LKFLRAGEVAIEITKFSYQGIDVKIAGLFFIISIRIYSQFSIYESTPKSQLF